MIDIINTRKAIKQANKFKRVIDDDPTTFQSFHWSHYLRGYELEYILSAATSHLISIRQAQRGSRNAKRDVVSGRRIDPDL